MTTGESQPESPSGKIVKPKGPSITGALLDEVNGPIVTEQLPRALDRLEVVLGEFLEAMPEFEGGGPFVEQRGTEMAGVRAAAREMCRQAGVPWKSKLEEQHWLEFLGFGKPGTCWAPRRPDIRDHPTAAGALDGRTEQS